MDPNGHLKLGRVSFEGTLFGGGLKLKGTPKAKTHHSDFVPPPQQKTDTHTHQARFLFPPAAERPSENRPVRTERAVAGSQLPAASGRICFCSSTELTPMSRALRRCVARSEGERKARGKSGKRRMRGRRDMEYEAGFWGISSLEKWNEAGLGGYFNLKDATSWRVGKKEPRQVGLHFLAAVGNVVE